MSYILDALNKSEEKRRGGTAGSREAPTVRVPPRVPESVMDLDGGNRKRNILLAGAAVTLLVGGLAGGYFISQINTPSVVDNGAGQPAENRVANQTPGAATPRAQPQVAQVPSTAMPPKQPSAERPVVAQPSPPKQDDGLIKVERLGAPEEHYGVAWDEIERGYFGRAVAQFSAAISWNPAYVDAYFGRAWAKEKAGLMKEALNDYSKTIDLRPDHYHAFFARGVLRHHLADFSNSARDFDVSFKRSSGEMRIYSALWRYVARRRAGGDAVSELENDITAIDMETWPGVIAAFYLGLATEADVLSHIRVRQAEEKPGLRCVAFFFIGMFRLMDGDTDLAKEAFNSALETGAKDFRQYEAARLELWRLENANGQ